MKNLVYIPQYDLYGLIKSVKVEVILDEQAGKIFDMTPEEIEMALEEIHKEKECKCLTQES